MTHRDALHTAIMSEARVMLATEREPTFGAPLGLSPASSLEPAGLPDSMAAARELFLEIFVTQALDQMAELLDANKDYAARAAAEAATWLVDALKGRLAATRDALTATARPPSGPVSADDPVFGGAADPRYPPQDPPAGRGPGPTMPY